jgi:hypothetical protein
MVLLFCRLDSLGLNQCRQYQNLKTLMDLFDFQLPLIKIQFIMIYI